MANFVIKEPREYKENVRKFETTDKGHADIFNAVIEILINNDAFLRESFVVSETMPTDQPVGGVWYDTSDGLSDIGESSVVIANAVVSETEPQDTSLLWMQTEPD